MILKFSLIQVVSDEDISLSFKKKHTIDEEP